MSNYVGFDLETTGVSSFHDVPVSFGFVEHVNSDGVFSTKTEGGYVNPGVPIPSGASAIHGITNDMVESATPLAEAVEMIANRLSTLWSSGGVIVGMNVGYDLTMVDSLCRRLSIPTLEERGVIGPVMDILVLDRRFDKWRKGARKLTDLCQHYGVDIKSAHSAADDAEASLDVFQAMTRQFPEISQIAPDQINVALRAWYKEWLTSFSQYLEKKGEAPIEAGRYEWPIHSEQ